MLVDPVRGQPRDDPPVPPGRGFHLLFPAQRGVPVVTDVMVVEDHGAGKGGQQPPVGGVGPGQVIEVRVFLVVLELFARRFVDVAAGADELLHLLTGQVCVDLVAEEGHQVRPRQVTTGGHRQGVGAEGVDAVGPVAGFVMRDAGTARAVGQAQRLAGFQCRDHRRWKTGVGLGPHMYPIDFHRVRQAPILAQFRLPPPARNGGRERRKYGPPSSRGRSGL